MNKKATNIEEEKAPKIVSKKSQILFSGYKDKANGWLSNFTPAPFVIDGRLWPTNEHYF